MNGHFVERVQQTNTSYKSIADQNWVMNRLTPYEKENIKQQCISTRHKEKVKYWDPETEKTYPLVQLRDNPSYISEKTGKYVYQYDSIKLINAIKNTIKARYYIKRKKTPMEYFKSEQSEEHDKYFETLAKRTILTAYRNIEQVRRFFKSEYDGGVIVLVHEEEIDACLASLLVPDIEIERTNERENK